MPDVQDARGTEHAQLLNQVDELLERYLLLLDEYQQARQQLSNDFSSGFLSLAQANFSSPSRTRYGQDYYDERMQATRTIAIHGDGSLTLVKVQLSDAPPTESSPDSDDTVENPETSGVSDSAGASKSTDLPRDPIHQFGILVPPALRATQSQFVKAVEEPIPTLVRLQSGLRQLESQIGRSRKNLKKTTDA